MANLIILSPRLGRSLDDYWLTGQHAPFAGYWVDQHGDEKWFDEQELFGPDRYGNCAHRRLPGATFHGNPGAVS